ncbi:MAG: hypothetical protein Q4C63_09540 [Eubacteriales bacterium]|nr:hypothetical protein [Eubacteriales bacterium]
MKQRKRWVWINPVAAQMSDPDVLARELARTGFIRVTAREDHAAAIRQFYRKMVTDLRLGGKCAGDIRCPAAVQMVRRLFPDAPIIFPDTDPILIRTAAELAGRLAAEGQEIEELQIVTPCQALCALGEKKAFPRTRFLTWKAFQQENDLQVPQKRLLASPVPLDFFRGCAEKVVSLEPWEKIEKWFQNGAVSGTDLAELLYCPGGCIGGDGI